MALRKYDWEGLFDGEITVLLSGQDYTCSQSAMAQMVRNNASQRGVRVRVIDQGNAIVVQVVGRKDGALFHTDPAAVSG